MRPNATLTALVVAVLAGLPGACGVARSRTDGTGPAGRPDLPAATLLAGRSDLPAAVTSTGYAAVQNKDVTVPPGPDFFGADDFALRTWGRVPKVPAFGQIALRYSTVAAAAREYDLAPYGRTYSDPDMGRLTPEPYAGPPLRADAFKLACLRSPLELRRGCSGWTFRARYGRYLVEANFSLQTGGSPVELDAQAFDAMVSSIDAHVGDVLHR
ncbi:hypothetical protein Sru01_22130 [Sphaerisporangium rufum]|uniref:Uncharacterized protein n=1 Tax=Sphaerisporangium rufum TaxID=1381558 RepID=A0A919UXQ0_9ACTN|nr:hypothetical protein [Sphaerisporangium rufum]GII77231.1 hypothetical protein Sru01_22130 [Sphaerisporangium rufum]